MKYIDPIEAFNDSMKYFNNDELAAQVFVDKYILKDNDGNMLEKNPKDVHRRLAKEFARIEKKKFKNPLKEDEIYDCIDQFRYIVPQGGPMYGIGNDFQHVSLSNCFFLDIPMDSYGDILRVDEQIVQVSKRRGGVGVCLDNLRPVGTPTKNAGKSSSGIIPFMDRYSNSIREVGQEGRRGALILMLSVKHPQILDFITVKNDKTRVTGANISVKVTNEFMQAVKDDKDFELAWPIDSKTPIITKKVKARHIWTELIKNAHANAEPGILFWDTVKRDTPSNVYPAYEAKGVNPCQPKWAKVLTKNGIREFKDINIGDEIWSETGWTKIINKWSNGIKPVYAYKTTFGTFYGTSNHRILQNNEKIEVGQAKTIDILKGNNINNVSLQKNIIMDGLIIGDGTIHKASNNLVLLLIGAKDHDYFHSEIAELIGKNRNYACKTAWEVITDIKNDELDLTFNRQIPDRYVKGDKNIICSFLRGLYSANGSICAQRITLKSTSFKLIEQTQIMLSSIGISSYFTTNKETKKKFKNGEYLCKPSYDLNITRDKQIFFECIGFIQKYKNEKLQNLLKISKYDSSKQKKESSKTIIQKEYINDEEVFDITVDNSTHTYWTNGLNVSNCSELILGALDSCRLMLMNLYSFVDNPFTKEAFFNFGKFEKYARICQRMMDDMVDLEAEKIEKIIQKIQADPEPMYVKVRELELWQTILKICIEGRRTGTGTTGLGDALAALGIKYGSKDSIIMVEKIFKTMKLSVYRESVEMAKELGSFIGFNAENEKKSEFIKRIKNDDENLYNDMLKYGRRNVGLITCAPAGSMSILTQTTSGVEPLFKLSYVRRKKINDKNVKADFVDENGDKWQEFTVYHGKLKEWIRVTGETNITKSPWYGCCAEDIDWKTRVDIQSAMQSHICHSISSTLNLPKDIDVDIVRQIYEYAWEKNLKGVTVYREGSRNGIMVDEKEKGNLNKIVKNQAPKRPKELPCEIYHIKISKKLDKIRVFDYMVLVGLLNGEAYETFAIENGKYDKKIVKGTIIKETKGRYHLIMEDGTEIKDITKDTTENEDALTRMTSTALRHGVDIQYIVDQLAKVEGEMFGFSKSIARSLKKYIKNGAISGETCTNIVDGKLCGAKLVFENGCFICKQCGNSRCN